MVTLVINHGLLFWVCLASSVIRSNARNFLFESQAKGSLSLLHNIWSTRLSFKTEKSINEASAASYLQSIRDSSSQLQAFFSLMPKGGDIHLHYSGESSSADSGASASSSQQGQWQ
jgi:hypothetical protein